MIFPRDCRRLGAHGLAVALLLLISLRAVPLHAQRQNKVVSIIVIDVRKSKPGVITVEQDPQNILAFRATWTEGACPNSMTGMKLEDLQKLTRCLQLSDKQETSKRIAIASSAATKIAELAQSHVKSADLRAIGSKGDSILIITLQRASLWSRGADTLLVRGGYSKLRISERARESQIQTDTRSLVRVAVGIAKASSGAGAGGAPGDTLVFRGIDWATTATYVLQRNRSTLTVQTSTEPPELTTLATTRDSAGTVNAIATGEAQVRQGSLREAAVKATLAAEALEVVAADAGTTAKADARLGPLIQLVEGVDNASDVRVAAAVALGEIGSPRALSTLRRALGDTSARVREAAATALGKIGAATTAVLPVAAGWTEGNADVAIASLAAATKSSTVDTIRATLLTGPPEHLFLSADVPLTDSLLLKFDEDKKAFNGAEAPSNFYIGVNWLLGDLRSEERAIWQNLVLRGMVAASKRPSESVGLGLAYRGSVFKSVGLDFELVSPFAAITWTRKEYQDPVTAAKKVTRIRGFRMGVSLNIDSAVQWLSGDK